MTGLFILVGTMISIQVVSVITSVVLCWLDSKQQSAKRKRGGK